MPRGLYRILLALMVLGVLVHIVPNARASAPSQESTDGNISYRESHRESVSFTSSGILDYWTPERLAGAQPWPDLDRAGGPSDAPIRIAQADGPAQRVNGNDPGAAEKSQEATAFYPPPGAGTSSFVYPFAYNQTWMSVPIAITTLGKLYFTQLGADYVCSGTSVTSGGANRSLVLTAGHCLHAGTGDDSGWSTNLLFIPAKLVSNEPYGSWTAFDWIVKDSYYQSGGFKDDYGFIITDPTSNVRGELSAAVGAQGVGWNQATNFQFTATGYPVGPLFQGETPVFCYSQFGAFDDPPGAGPQTMGIGCNMTGGSSGGGWLVAAKLVTKGWVNSVTSYKFLSQPNAVYGPYFDGSFGALWAEARLIDPTP